MAARSKAWVCGCSIAGIVGSNPAGVMDILSHMSAICCQVEASAPADHPSRGVLPGLVCLTECDHEAKIMRRLGSLVQRSPTESSVSN